MMHICCANCALFPLESLHGRGLSVRGLWFNPNIEPEDEHARRLAALHGLEAAWGLDIRPEPGNENSLYKEAVASSDGVRCEACYGLRLMRTAEVASEEGMDAFTTSLLVSPFQKHELVAQAGRMASERHGVPFLYEDMRPGWDRGRALSRELGLYRQNYCGCSASLREREAERVMRKRAKAAHGGFR